MAHGQKSSFSIYDLSDRGNPTLIRRLYVEGELQAARLIDGTMRAAITFMGRPDLDIGDFEDRPPIAGVPTEPVGATSEPSEGQASSAGSPGAMGSRGEGEDRPAMAPVPAEDGEGALPIEEEADEDIDDPRNDGRAVHDHGEPEDHHIDDIREAVREAINETALSDWVPMAYDAIGEERVVRQVTRCEQFHRPGERAGIAVTSVISIDLDEPSMSRSEPAVISGPGIVYADDTELYVTTSNYAGFRGGFGGDGVDVAVLSLIHI